MFNKIITIFTQVCFRFSFFSVLLFLASQVATAHISPVQNVYANSVASSVSLTDNDQQKYAKNGLLKPAMIFSDSACKQIIEALQVINQDIAYWHYQKAHPFSYFFHKSPTKWVVGRKQSDEIDLNSSFLQKLQVQLYEMLGKVAMHVDECVQDATDAERYLWIEKLLGIVSFIDEDGIMTANQGDKIATRLHDSLKAVGSLKEKILTHCAHARKPYHITANWMLYIAAAAGAGCAGYYGYNNAAMIQQSVGDMMQKLFKKYDEFKSAEPFFNEQASKDGYEVAKKEIDTFVRAAHKAGSMTTQQGNEILNDLKVGGDKGLYKYLLSLSSYYPNENVKVVKMYAGHIKYRMFYMLSCIEKGAYSVGGKVAIAMPVLGGLWGMKKLYQWNAYSDYSPIRIALARVNSVLIESVRDELNAHDCGKLIYLIAQLKDTVVSHLSSQDTEYQEFVADIEKLESSKFTLRARQAMIDNMYKRYAFLSVI